MFMNFHEEFFHLKFSRCQLFLEILDGVEVSTIPLDQEIVPMYRGIFIGAHGKSPNVQVTLKCLG